MSGGAAGRKLAFLYLVCALSSGCIMRSVEDRFIFFPSRELVGSPADIGLEYSSVYLTTDDDLRLHGWWVPAEHERGVVLFLHGNAGNISDRLESIRIFRDLDLSVFIFDYRGYGRSEGEPSEPGTYTDAETAWRYLTEERGIAPERIVLFGRSLGGAVAAELALHHQPRALILESTFTSVRDMASSAMPMVPVGRFLRTRYDTLSKMRQVTCPVLIVHSREDEIIPFRQGRALYEAALPPKAFLELRFGHNEGFVLSGETYTTGVEKFLAEYVAPAPVRPRETLTADSKPPAEKERKKKKDSEPAEDTVEEHDAETPPATEPPDTEAPPDGDLDDLPADEPPLLD